MQSITKPHLSDADIRRLIRDGLGDGAEVVDHHEFTDGYFNAAHGVRLSDGRELVLKVAPDAGLKLLRYEVDLMHTEIEFFDRAAAAGVPLPKLWHADPERGIMIMERLRGESFSEARKVMEPAEALEIRRELGRISATITAVPGELFGYPRRDGRTRSASWRTSYLEIIDDVLADATETDRPLPRPAAEIRELIARHSHLLDEVRVPTLLHFDLWDGNVFVIREGDGWRVEGLIDGERALYGDPIAELVSLCLSCTPAETDAVVDGFRGRPLTPGEQTRLCLYRTYLWLILIAETAVRGYPAEDGDKLTAWATERLIPDLDELARVGS